MLLNSAVSHLKEKHNSTDRLMLWLWWGGYSWERGYFTYFLHPKQTTSFFFASLPVAALTRLLLQWWGGLFIYFLKATRKNLAQPF